MDEEEEEEEKRYKYLYLKEVLNYYEMDDGLKSIKAVQGKQLSRGAAGVAYENAAHLLDAANFVKEAWDAISETIANSCQNRDNDPYSRIC